MSFKIIRYIATKTNRHTHTYILKYTYTSKLTNVHTRSPLGAISFPQGLLPSPLPSPHPSPRWMRREIRRTTITPWNVIIPHFKKYNPWNRKLPIVVIEIKHKNSTKTYKTPIVVTKTKQSKYPRYTQLNNYIHTGNST